MLGPGSSPDPDIYYRTTKKPASLYTIPVICDVESDSALNLIGTEASGTSVHMARSSVDDGLDTLDVGLPSAVGASVGVRDLDSEGHALATIITLRHYIAPPNIHHSYASLRRLDMIADFNEKCKYFFTIF